MPLVLLGACIFSCRPRVELMPALPPLETEGQLRVYLEPLPKEAERLTIVLGAATATRSQGAAVDLELHLRELSMATTHGARLLAAGRLPPGSYAGLGLHVVRATLSNDHQTADLLVEPAPATVRVPFSITAKRATVLRLTFQFQGAIRGDIAFAPHFLAEQPEAAMPAVLGLATSQRAHEVTLFDRRSRRVVGAVPTGREPAGIAIDPLSHRAFVALAGEDAIDVVDLLAREVVERIRLKPGDRPAELVKAGGVLLCSNPGSGSLAFLDPTDGIELERIRVGEEPGALVLDPRDHRAYVINTASNELSVVDLANRARVRTVGTEARPLRGKLNRAGDLLYVIHAGSPTMLVFSVPDLTVVQRIFVGLGMRSLEIDRTTDRIYLGLDPQPTLMVFAPGSPMPIETIKLPAPASFLVIDEVERLLLMTLPELEALGALRLGDRSFASTLEIGAEPTFVALP